MTKTSGSLALVALFLALGSTSALAQDAAAGGGEVGNGATGGSGVGNGATEPAPSDASDSSTSTSTSTSTTASASAGGSAALDDPNAAHHAAPAAGEGVGEEPEVNCDDAPVFDPSTPRFELQVGGGYSALFHTWRQTSDNFMTAPVGRPDGLYHGPLFRGEVAFAFGGVSVSAIYTHLWLNHDGQPANVELGLLSGEVGVQCACRGSFYVWSFGIEVGGNVLGPGTVFLSIEHRSMFYVWEGLFVGFDVDIATFIGMTMGGPSGGGILGSLFLGYSFG